MGPQGKRWPKWKPRRDNSGDDVTEENRRKKLHHGVKLIRKVRRRARERAPAASVVREEAARELAGRVSIQLSASPTLRR